MKHLIYLLILLTLLFLAPLVYAGEKHPCEEYVCVAQFNFGFGFGFGGGGGGGPAGDGFLLETGDFLLMETDDYLLLE